MDPAGLIILPITAIVPSRWQPRQIFAAERLLELALDIRQHGVLTPPIVWQIEDGEYELIAGERRLRACYALFMFHQSPGPGSFANRPFDSYVTEVWESGNNTIGRCRLYRLKQPETNLPDLAGGIDGDPATMLYLLGRVSGRESYSHGRWGPRWLDAKRTKPQDAPSWSNCEPALARLIPLLSPGRRLALLLLFEDPFEWSSAGYGTDLTAQAFVPQLGRNVPYTRKETIER